MFEVALNEYYLEAVNDIEKHITASNGGKRYFDHNGNWWKDESTYPDYARFFFLNKRGKTYKDGYFNGNRIGLLRLIKKAKGGVLPNYDRLQIAFSFIIEGYLEEQYKLKLLDEEFERDGVF